MEAPPPGGENAKRIFHHTPPPGAPVVEDVLAVVQVPLGIGLDHVPAQRERVVPNQEVGDVSVVPRQRSRIRQAECPLPQGGLQVGLIEDTAVRLRPRRAHIGPDELVVGVDEPKEDDGEEALVAVEVAATLLGLDDPHMLPVKGPTAVVEVPPGAVDPLDLQPLSRGGGGSELLLPVLLHYGVTDLGDEEGDGVVGNTEAEGKAVVGVASGEEPQGNGQLQTWLQGGSVPHVLLYPGRHSGQELVEHLRLYSEEAPETYNRDKY